MSVDSACSEHLIERWNQDQYQMVRDARIAAGLPVCETIQMTSHPLEGQTLIHKPSQACYVIEHVAKTWWRGFYLRALARGADRQDGIEVIVAGTCHDPAVQAELQRFEEEFELVPAAPHH